jgi:hypothetical protein
MKSLEYRNHEEAQENLKRSKMSPKSCLRATKVSRMFRKVLLQKGIPRRFGSKISLFLNTDCIKLQTNFNLIFFSCYARHKI